MDPGHSENLMICCGGRDDRMKNLDTVEYFSEESKEWRNATPVEQARAGIGSTVFKEGYSRALASKLSIIDSLVGS